MKFMKLGSRPDTFYTTEAVRSVSSEISSDLIVQVKSTTYLLHKFPLLSKCLKLQRLCSESPETCQHQTIRLPDFPGSIEAFELCTKFCYGITITVSAHNIVSARCAAEYLQMTEDVEKGNLICKLEAFLNSCILSGWRDSIVTLQSTKPFPLWSQDLGITSRCIDAIASKVSAHPCKMNLSRSYSIRGMRDDVSCNGSESSSRHRPLSKDWWAEDLAELSIDHYWRIMIAIKSGGKVAANLIGDALRIYASRWLPNISRCESRPQSNHRLVLESIISLLPAERGAASCSFLLKLLKAANILKASSSSKMELARRVGVQLEDATVGDLLIPCVSRSSDSTIYDVDIVMSILEEFMLQWQSPPTSPPRMKGDFERRRSRSAENIDHFEFQESRRSSSASHSSKLKVAKLIDRYLQEIASEEKLPLTKFISIAEAIPGFARLDHDDLYRAIDIYLKGHPCMSKKERKRLCRMLDCKKLSMEVCMHAAQNELLPLRVVVQVLFFEQARATSMSSDPHSTELPSHIKLALVDRSKTCASFTNVKMAPSDDQWRISGLKSPKIKPVQDECLDESKACGNGKSSRPKASCVFPSRSKRMFSKAWTSNRSVASDKN